MFQALLSNASRRVCSHAQHIHGSDRTLSSIIRGTNCKLSKSTQSIFSSNSTRTNYHTSIYSLKSSKKKKLRQSEPDDAVLELGRYERNEQGDWVRRVVKNKPRTAVLSPELEADIARVLEQDIDELAAPSRDQPRHVKSTDKKKTSTSAKAAVTRATEQSSATTKKKKKKSKSRAVQSEGTLAIDKELVGQYKELIDESDFKQTKTREIRAPSESNEETEHAVAQVVAWLKKEKLSDLCAIDLRLKTDWARFMVIATAMSERQNRAAAESIAHRLGQLRGKSYEVHTGGEDNWLIIFTGDMVIELFTEERRKFYDIERLWVLKRSLQEEMDIDPDDLVRFQYDEEDGMYDDEVRAKIAAERLARGEVVEEPEPVREVPEETPVIPYSSRDAKLDKKSKKRRRP